MTWFKVDDSFYDHPKVFDAPDSAVALWTRAGSWSARNLTDGFVPTGMPARFCDDHETAVRELVRRGLWSRTSGGYRFHDWDQYQPTRQEAIAGRQKMASGGALGNHRRWHTGKGKSDPSCRYCHDALGPSGTDEPDATRSAPDGSVTNPRQDFGSGKASYPQGSSASRDGPPDSRSSSDQDQRDRVGHRVPDQVGDRAPESPPNPPVPARPGPTGGTGGTTSHPDARANPEPPPRCPKHLHNPDPPPCGPCADARRLRAQWETDRRNRLAAAPQCQLHRGQPADNCAPCRSESLALSGATGQYRTVPQPAA